MKTVVLALLLFGSSVVSGKMVVGVKPPPPKDPPAVFGYELLERGQKKLAQVRKKKNLDPHGYNYCKALSWLQFAKELLELSPYDGNANLATNEAIRLAEQLEKGSVNELQSGIFSDYKILRVGLWDAAQHFQPEVRRPCGPCFRGQLEVQLVAAGHQANKSGDDVAQELIEVAEELEQQMKKPTRSCLAQQPIESEIEPTSPIVEPPSVAAQFLEPVNRGEILAFQERFKDLNFYFHQTGHSIKNLVNVLTYKAFRKKLSDDMPFKKLVLTGQLKKVKVTGHSDQSHPADYQKKISADRAIQIAKDLRPILGGVEIEMSGVSSSRPLKTCRNDDKNCSLLNNRVEIQFVFAP